MLAPQTNGRNGDEASLRCTPYSVTFEQLRVAEIRNYFENQCFRTDRGRNACPPRNTRFVISIRCCSHRLRAAREHRR